MPHYRHLNLKNHRFPLPLFVSNHEMFNDAKTLHYGSNLAKDMCRGTLVRSGSVSIGRRERVEEDHPKGEKQITAQN